MSKLTKEITARLVEKESPTKLEKNTIGLLIGNLRALLQEYSDDGDLGSSRVSMRAIARLEVGMFEGLITKQNIKLVAKIIAQAKVSAALLNTVKKDTIKWEKLSNKFHDVISGDKDEYNKLMDWR